MNIWLRLGLFLLLCFAVSTDASAVEEAWLGEGGGVKIVANVSASPPGPFACSGLWRQVTVKNEGTFTACTFGTERQVVVYDNRGLRAAVKYPYEAQALAIENLCRSGLGCQYGEEADVLIDRVYGDYSAVNAVLYREFISSLRREGEVYRFHGGQPTRIHGTDDVALRLGAVTLSRNGRWAAVELYEKGTAIVNTGDGSLRRVAAQGYSYGIGRNPVERMAVSNDGLRVFVSGRNAGFYLYEHDGRCGDTVSSTASRSFAPQVTPCPSADAGIGGVEGGFLYGQDSYFIDEASALVVSIETRQGQIRKLVIRPEKYATAVPLSYSALGDSFTSGEGETSASYYEPGTDSQNNTCHVSSRSYPYIAATLSILHPVAKNRACSGAIIHDIFSPRSAHVQGQAYVPIAEQSDLVTISIGGNDIGLIDKLKRCLMPDTCLWTSPSMKSVFFDEIERVGVRLTELYRRLQASLPHAKLIAVGYPDAVVVDGVCDALTGVLLNREERELLQEGLHRLNLVMRQAATTAGIRFVDLENAYGQHGLCGSARPNAMNAMRAGDDIAPISAFPSWRVIGAESFHPTPFGHQRAAPKISQALDEEGCGCLPVSETPPRPYWNSLPTINAQWLKQRIISDKVFNGTQYEVRTEENTFSPHSHVTVEAHSEPQHLGEFIVDSQGSLKGTLLIPESLEAGYHTLTVASESPSGANIVVYQTVLVTTEEAENPERVAASAAPHKTREQPTRLPFNHEPTHLVENGKHPTMISSMVLSEDTQRVDGATDNWPLTFLTLLVVAGIILSWLLFAHLLRK